MEVGRGRATRRLALQTEVDAQEALADMANKLPAVGDRFKAFAFLGREPGLESHRTLVGGKCRKYFVKFREKTSGV